jgi:dihydrofolate synthase/folylpolyglutamate synthase
MDYKSSLDYLDRLQNHEKIPYYDYKKAYSLSNLRYLLSLLGNPQDGYPSVIVAGTKGKGSTASFLSSILTASGKKTGLYTSPHLTSINERIKIDGADISKNDFANYIEKVKREIDKNTLNGITYFEALTAACLLYFAGKKADIAVLEAGLGGRLDATNVVNNLMSVITPISRDHIQILGSRLDNIAKEKAGIIKDRTVVVSAPQNRAALRQIKRSVESKDSRFILIGKDAFLKCISSDIRKTVFALKTKNRTYKNICLSLPGQHQAVNAATAVAAAEALGKKPGFDISKTDILRGLKNTRLGGRLQRLGSRPFILLLDGAHNEASARALGSFIGPIAKKSRLILILAVSSDKDAEGIGRHLCPLADYTIFTNADTPRAFAPQGLALRLSKYASRSLAAYGIKDAFVFAKAIAEEKDIILITGSLFILGDFLKHKKAT